MFKIDKSLVDNMNINKSYIVITHKEIWPPDNGGAVSGDLSVPEANEGEPLPFQKAQDQTKAIVQAALDKAEEIEKSAWQAGYDKGREKAERELAGLRQAQMDEFNGILGKMESAGQEFLDGIQSQILQLAMDIAEKIVNIQLKRDDTVYVGIVKKAMASFKSKGKMVLRVSRTEYNKYFKDDAERLQTDFGIAFEVVNDPDVEEGGCILESEEGILNAGVGIQLEKIQRSLEQHG